MAAATQVKHSKLDAVHINPGLDIVYPNEETSLRTDIKVDIIAIPGLGANPEWTWKRNKVHWLRDSNMLPKKITGARISVFNYQSQWFGKGSVNQRIDSVATSLLHALDRMRGNDSKIPIIFVSHCLGGILLEKALLTSRLRQNDFPSVYPWVAGCIFLGTPFHGTKTSSKAMVLADMAEAVGLGTSSNLLKMLERDSELLTSLLDDFALLAKDAQIRLFCFFEQEKSDLVSLFIKGSVFKSKELIVDELSATIPAVEKLPLASDHFHMNKYESPKDGNFKYVSDEIKLTYQKAAGILKSRQNLLRQALVNDRTYYSIMDHLGKGFQDVDAAQSGSYRGPKGAKLSSVLELDSFKNWHGEDSAPLLWIHGKAGTGQGAVASSAIEYLKKSQEQGSIVTSFFCDQSDKQRRSLKGLLQLIVRQTISTDQDLARHLLSDSKKGKDSGKQDFDSEETLKVPVLWDALLNIARDLTHGRVYIVIYGLEQLAEESLTAFLEYIKEVSSPRSVGDDEVEAAPIKWLLLSRSGRPSIEKALKPTATEINLEHTENSAQVSDDLRTHISVSVNELGLPSSLAYFAKRHIHSRAEDNWIYVSLVVQELKNAWVPGRTQHAEIRKLLESFPYGLTDMFEHIRKRVLDPQAEGFEYTKEILRCRICAYVAPTLRELAIMAGLPEEDRDDLDRLKAYIVRCGAFLTIRENDWEEENNTVEWIDISAQEHLEQYSKDTLSLELNDMQHGIIALRSLEYIYRVIEAKEAYDARQAAKQEHHETDSQVGDESAEVKSDNESSHTKDKDDEDNKSIEDHESEHDGQDEDAHSENAEPNQKAPSVAEVEEETPPPSMAELKYPVRYWVEHAIKAPRDVLDEFNFDHTFWQDDSEPRQTWWKIIEDVHGRSDHNNVSALHVAVILKFPALVDHFLESGRTSDIHKEDSLGFQPLYYACEGGQEEIVNALLGVDTDINFVSDNDKPTALYAAADNGHRDTVATLLDRDADIDATSPEHGTALYAAARNSNIEMLKLLLEKGANVNIIGGAGRRALNIAAFVGNLEAARILVEKGADIDPEEDYVYGSALGAATRRGHDDVVKYLLSQKWNPNRHMKTYGSFLTAAATYNHLEAFETLLATEKRELVIEQALQAAAQRGYAPIVKIILDKNTTLRYQKAFSLAASFGRTDALRLLLERGIDQVQLDESLFKATDNEHLETVQLLLDFNANPNAEGPEYGYALIASAYDGTTDIMKALIEKGADVNKRGGTWGMALIAASWYGDAENVKLLIDHGATLNTEPIGSYGTELSAAVYTGDEDTIRLLLKEGADVNSFGGDSCYPIIAAAEEGDGESFRILLEHGADVNVRGGEDNWPLLSLAASTLLKEDLELILNKGADINATCDKGTTALINCADAMDNEGLQFLLDNGADVHIVSENLGTALHAAAYQGDEDCCETLLKAGAEVNAIGGEYGTPLQAAAWAEDIETVRVLLEAGADVTDSEPIAGEYGTALQAAAFVGHWEIIEELLDKGAVVNASEARGKYGNALSAAATEGFEGIATLLIEHGADVDAEGGLHGFPILAAAQAGNYDLVELLLEHDANVSVEGGLLGSAVTAAAYGNNLAIIEKLIEHGASPHATGGKYGTALQAAAIKGSDEVVDDLLSRTHDLINHCEGKYHTALIAAAYFNRLEVVTKLLDAGADIQFQGGHYHNAITAAAIRGNKAVLDKLLSKGPPDHLLDEALVEACAHRQSTSVDALLKAGANINATHPTLGLAVDALTVSEAEDENSDIETEQDDDDDSDLDSGSDEEDEDEDEEWEGDNNSVSGETEGSVTDLQLEEEIPEAAKIQKLLDEAMARCQRNPTVKRFRTVKHQELPQSLRTGPPTLPTRKPVPNQGLTGGYPAQQSGYSNPPAFDRTTSQHDYAVYNQQAPPPTNPYNSPPLQQQYQVEGQYPPHGQYPTQGQYPPQDQYQRPQRYSMPPPQHQSQQQFNQAQQQQYQPYTSPPIQEGGYTAYNQGPSSTPPMQGSQYAGNTQYGGQQGGQYSGNTQYGGQQSQQSQQYKPGHAPSQSQPNLFGDSGDVIEGGKKWFRDAMKKW